jgi:hypothetical protein
LIAISGALETSIDEKLKDMEFIPFADKQKIQSLR